MVEKLATFRSDKDTWESFIAKAKANGTNASALLQGFVQSYLNGEAIQTSRQPDTDIQSMIDMALDSRLQNAVTAMVTEKIEPMHESIKQAIATLDSLKLSKELVDEAIATAKKPLMQIVREKTLAA
jgi:hypothetical protein